MDRVSVTMGLPVRLRLAVPVFWTVKVRVTVLPLATSTLPKSVPFPPTSGLGDGSPSMIDTNGLPPSTLISGTAPVPWIEKL